MKSPALATSNVPTRPSFDLTVMYAPDLRLDELAPGKHVPDPTAADVLQVLVDDQ